MARSNVLILPGWQSSGPQHWQSRWEAQYGDHRVEQHDWMRPLRGDWIARLEEIVLERPGSFVLVAHSLGCLLVAAWAAYSKNAHRIRGALLAAPSDPDQEQVSAILSTWRPVSLQPLPFPSVLVASQNDPYCSLQRARSFALAWGSEFLDYGNTGHINAESGIGDWPQGRALLNKWMEEK
jgi:predicted alpha/beta hydrolase family esterase